MNPPTVFGLAHLDHDGDHVLFVCDGTVTRAWEICDELNRTRRPHEQLELIEIEVRR